VPEDFFFSVDFDEDDPESLEDELLSLDDEPGSLEDDDEPESPDDDEPESADVFVSPDVASPEPEPESESLFFELSSAAFSRWRFLVP